MAEVNARMQNKTPIDHTRVIDPVESYRSGVMILFRESKKKGMHTPTPIKVS